ncbi:hypothetical protein GGR25_003482 [Kaistia hirudinis]|uniref:Lipoprotein n=1 Tax=Kaistia hirudinis TaxID=1293440 RepID=A0A840ASD0_9HYPH|nr:hypothetical protein [Kaistia hirudinis]MBB3932424.1 hypothetical protein [Kaistia hirudinis]
MLLSISLTLGALQPSLPVHAETAVAAEKNPPGDIPDSQVFIVYSGPSGASMKVPEGWARKDLADGARFFDKYNAVELTIGGAAVAPTVASARDGEVADLVMNGHAIKIMALKPVKLPGGTGVVVEYTENSDPNPVTNKQIRLEGVRYLIFSNGKLATLDMKAPAGADNVDQWKLMATSVRLK